MIAASKNDYGNIMLIPALPHLTKVLSLLVNPSVTELDCTVYDGSFSYAKINNLLMKHALQNCPNIRKINFGRVEDDIREYQKRMPIERLKKSWNNLKSIKTEGYYYEEDTLKFIQENFPNIESDCLDCPRDYNLINLFIHRELSICITPLTQAAVDHLINMKKLHTLKFDYGCKHTPEFIISVAWEVPSLRNFVFKAEGNQNQFIEEFGEKCPQKELLVNKLTYVPVF
jgi:hypothetical protein